MRPVYHRSMFGDFDPLQAEFNSTLESYKSQIKEYRRNQIKDDLEFDMLSTVLINKINSYSALKQQLVKEFLSFDANYPVATLSTSNNPIYVRTQFGMPGNYNVYKLNFSVASPIKDPESGNAVYLDMYQLDNIQINYLDRGRPIRDWFKGKVSQPENVSFWFNFIDQMNSVSTPEWIAGKLKQYYATLNPAFMNVNQENMGIVLDKFTDSESKLQAIRRDALNYISEMFKDYADSLYSQQQLDILKDHYNLFINNFAGKVDSVPTFEDLLKQAEQPDPAPAAVVDVPQEQLVPTQEQEQAAEVARAAAFQAPKKSNTPLYLGAAALAFLFLRK